MNCFHRSGTFFQVVYDGHQPEYPGDFTSVEQMVDEIEQKLKNSLEGEVSSRAIGELAMEELRGIDQVAYVRFASVYREFQDINSFMEELRKILDEKERSGL